MTFFLHCYKKEDILRNVLVFFSLHKMEVNGNQSRLV